MVTTASKISPLNGLNTTHWYFTGKVTNPVPSRMSPFPTFSMPVTATTKPCRPLQKSRKFSNQAITLTYSLTMRTLFYLLGFYTERNMILKLVKMTQTMKCNPLVQDSNSMLTSAVEGTK